jgi:hypothetical protein
MPTDRDGDDNGAFVVDNVGNSDPTPTAVLPSILTTVLAGRHDVGTV